MPSKRKDLQDVDIAQEYFSTFNIILGDDWVLTGSEAIRLYLKHIDRMDLLKFIPKDIDIFYLSNAPYSRKYIGNFSRLQDSPQRSMTFFTNELSFDMDTKANIPYFLIDGI